VSRHEVHSTNTHILPKADR